MIIFILTRKDRYSHEALEDDAAEGPHVDGCGVGNTEHDLWSPVEPRLNVSVEPFKLEAAASVVDQLNLALVGLDQQDVLWLEVAVNYRELVHVVEGLQDLNREPLGQSN